ncbi:MAG: M56 family metallopeptidase [Daejeonella sp.]|uniref:M56 family metallopeptidase n=1 Tax=Daejeonella sp. TaxID=2805397 RepID=UPI003C757109
MIEYLIKSGLVLVTLLAIYHLWLEKEKMHQFNRYYLLFSLVIGLIIPVLKIPLNGPGISTAPMNIGELVVSGVSPTVPLELGMAAVEQSPSFLMMLYIVIASILLMRFVINLFLITRSVARNPKQDNRAGTIVLIKEKLTPHSFLFFIFLNEDDYLNNKIEKEIIEHEFAHVRQKHSVDLLFLELLMVIFWFNPVFIFFKKAIQLNHEFLADEAVIESSCSISTYQQLLLQKATLKPVQLASNFNYSVTKKRFKMMKKQTSKTKKVVKVASLLPVAALLIMAFNDNVFSQGTSTSIELNINIDKEAQLTKDEYYKGAYMRYINSAGVKIRKRYEELTREEKSLYPSPVQPTDELMAKWRDPQKFVVLIGYEKPQDPLSNYKAKDFVSYYALEEGKDSLVYIYLIKKDFLEKIKQLGGDFNREGNQVFLTPPPPVLVPTKK